MTFKDRFYRSYTSTHITDRKGEASLERFQREFPTWNKHFSRLIPADPAAVVLDVGCGRGGLVYWLHQRGYRNAAGIDLSAEQVATARRLGIPQIQQADVTEFLAGRRGHYDALILRDVLEHFTGDEIVEVLNICRSAIRPGGVVIVQVPNAESPFFGRIRYGDFTHETAFTISSINQLFNVIGFAAITVFPTDPPVTGARSLLRCFLWNVVKAFYHMLVFAELGRGRRIFTQGLIAVGRVPTADQPL
jgi:2-polyprenyl-3-methyl-5-hydroxy-6-metoxy-1,4-benzoquinol methylase